MILYSFLTTKIFLIFKKDEVFLLFEFFVIFKYQHKNFIRLDAEEFAFKEIGAIKMPLEVTPKSLNQKIADFFFSDYF